MRMYLDYFLARFGQLRGDRKGVTALEYAIIAAVTVLVTGAGVAALSAPLSAMWGSIAAKL